MAKCGSGLTPDFAALNPGYGLLPSAEALVAREDNVKVTLGLSRRSVDYFKHAAKKRGVPYQRMIRALVDTYAERQAGAK